MKHASKWIGMSVLLTVLVVGQSCKKSSTSPTPAVPTATFTPVPPCVNASNTPCTSTYTVTSTSTRTATPTITPNPWACPASGILGYPPYTQVGGSSTYTSIVRVYFPTSVRVTSIISPGHTSGVSCIVGMYDDNGSGPTTLMANTSQTIVDGGPQTVLMNAGNGVSVTTGYKWLAQSTALSGTILYGWESLAPVPYDPDYSGGTISGLMPSDATALSSTSTSGVGIALSAGWSCP